jgi:23S rRNA G2445 N2-methylase RlmL
MKKLFITCSRGLEPLLSRELIKLGYTQQQQSRRGVQLHFSLNTSTHQILHAIYRFVRIPFLVLISSFFSLCEREVC